MSLLSNDWKPDHFGKLQYIIGFYEFGERQASKILNEVDKCFYSTEISFKWCYIEVIMFELLDFLITCICFH